MNNIKNKEFKCCGCNTCMEICPQKAIKMIESDEGFLEYSINEELCTSCGLCIKKCPQINDIKEEKTFVPKYYAAHMKSKDGIIKSSSGGIFQVIAKKFTDTNNYAIFGAVYDEDLNVKHDYIDNINDLEKLLGSKYVQSNISNIYKKVKDKLNEKDIKVLFVGTPCQIAGLNSYLNNKYYENLITIDLICHGVPSPLLFKKYIDYLELRHNGKVEKFNFRSKLKKEWGTNCYYKINGKEYYKPYYLDPYYYNFIKGTIYRESCYECKYARRERVGDITLGDYWGIDEIHPEIYNKLGNSIIIINSIKGENVFEKIKEEIIYIESTFEKMSKYNHNLISPTQRKDIRDSVYTNIRKEDFSRNMNRYLNFNINYKNIIKSKIPNKIKKVLKKCLKK